MSRRYAPCVMLWGLHVLLVGLFGKRTTRPQPRSWYPVMFTKKSVDLMNQLLFFNLPTSSPHQRQLSAIETGDGVGQRSQESAAPWYSAGLLPCVCCSGSVSKRLYVWRVSLNYELLITVLLITVCNTVCNTVYNILLSFSVIIPSGIICP